MKSEVKYIGIANILAFSLIVFFNSGPVSNSGAITFQLGLSMLILGVLNLVAGIITGLISIVARSAWDYAAWMLVSSAFCMLCSFTFCSLGGFG